MFEEKPEISDTLEWMLQSRQVGDETLVNTLVHEQYAPLYKLALSFFNSPDSESAEKLAEQVFSEAVEDANQYREEIGVEIWLFSKAFKAYERWTAKKTHVIDNLVTGGEPKSVGDAHVILKAIEGMQDDRRLVFTLNYHQELTNKEIANVLDLSEPEVELRLSVAEGEFVDYIEAERGNSFPRSVIHETLTKRWPAPVLSTRGELLIAGKILNSLKNKEKRKRRIVVLWEIALVVIAILIIAGMGRAITASTPELSPVGTVLHTQLVNQIVFVSPTPGPTQPPTPFPEQAILYVANEGETLAEIGERIFLSVEILAALNNMPPDQALERGQQVIIGVSDSQIIMPTPIGSTLVPLATLPQEDPLTLESSEEKIRDRILGSRSRWQSLWADAMVIQYGPLGYVGGPDMRRQQIWISQPYFSYMLDGEISGEVEYITSALGGLINYINLLTGEQMNNTETELVHVPQDLQQLLMPSEFREDFVGEIEVLGMEEVAGREALVFDWFTTVTDLESASSEGTATRLHQGRYWVDTNIGAILRRQKFNANDVEQLFEETIISKIEFNVNVPHRLFDRSQPLQTYFASDHQGDPISGSDLIPTQTLVPQVWRAPILQTPAPSNYDPSDRRLRFQWTSLSSFDPDLGTRVDLFADEYFLANIEFADPNQIMCTRSADGRLVAFTSLSEDSRFGYVPLQWFSLTDLPTVHQEMPEIVPYDFAFAPDNRQLAVYGCEQQVDAGCGIFIIDTQSGEIRKLTDVERGSGLIWNPDSSEIAIQGSLLRKGKWRVLVFDTETGNVLFDGPFDWEGFWVAPDSPIHDWGVPYPPVRGGLEICSEPPA